MNSRIGFLLICLVVTLLAATATAEQENLRREVVIIVSAQNPNEEVEFDAVMLPSPKPLREVLTLETPCEIHLDRGLSWIGIFQSRGGKIVVEQFVNTGDSLKRKTSGTGYTVLSASDLAGGVSSLVVPWPHYSELKPFYSVK